MEKSPSWSRAHDWKSCRPLKGLEGSNPSFSARDNHIFGCGYFFCDVRYNQESEARPHPPVPRGTPERMPQIYREATRSAKGRPGP